MSGSRTLRVTILGDASGAARALAETGASAGHLEGVIGGLGASFSRVGDVMRGAFAGIGFAAVQAGIEGLRGAFGAIKSSVIDTNAELERSAVSWGVLLGSTDAAKQHLADLSKFAAQTPFSFPEVDQASRLLRTFGGAALDTSKNLTLVGDIAAGVGQPFSDVAMWTGRMYSAMKNGQPFGEAAARLQEMGAMSGETRLQLEQMQKAGASSDQMWQAFTTSMGRFGGMMDKQSRTFSGQLSTLQDNLNLLAAAAGKPIFDALTAGMGKLNVLLSSDAVQHGIERIAAGIQAALAAAGRGGAVFADLARYLRAVVDDGDYLNDWATHLPAALRPAVEAFGRLLGPAIQLVYDAIVTFKQALAGNWFGGQTQSINTFVRTLGRLTQLGRDAVLTFRQAFAGDWFKGGAGDKFVNTVGAIGLAIGNAVRAVKPFVPELLIVARAIGTITSPLLSFAKAWAQTGGDVRSALNLMRRNVSDGLLALGDLLRRAGPPLAKALWGFLGDAAGDFAEWWRKNDVNGKIRAFLGRELPRLFGQAASGAGNLASKLWEGLGSAVDGFVAWWQRNNVTEGIKERLGRFLGGIAGTGDALWTGLGDLVAAFAAWWQKNDVNGKIVGFLQDRLTNLGDFAGSIWEGITDLPGKFADWWQKNTVGGQIKDRLGDLLGKIGDFAGNIWANITDLAGSLVKWWQDNGVASKVAASLSALLGDLGDFGAELWGNLGDLAAQFKDWWQKNDVGGKINAFLKDDAGNWVAGVGPIYQAALMKEMDPANFEAGRQAGKRFGEGFADWLNQPLNIDVKSLQTWSENIAKVAGAILEVMFLGPIGAFLAIRASGISFGFVEAFVKSFPKDIEAAKESIAKIGQDFYNFLISLLPKWILPFLPPGGQLPSGGGGGAPPQPAGPVGPQPAPGPAPSPSPSTFTPGNFQALAFGGGGGLTINSLTVSVPAVEFRETPEDVGVRIARAMVGEMKNLTQQNGGGGGGVTGGPIL